MKLNEIRLGSMDKDVSRLTYFHKANTKKIGKIDEYDIYTSEKTGNRNYYVFLTNAEKEPVGQFHLIRNEFNNDSIYTIGSSKLFPEAQGRNIGYKLYIFLIVKMGLSLLSDSSQSRGAQKLYMKLARHPNITAYGVDLFHNNRYTQLSYDEVNDILTGDLFDIYSDITEITRLSVEIDKISTEISRMRKQGDEESIKERERLERYFDQLISEKDYYDNTGPHIRIMLTKKI